MLNAGGLLGHWWAVGNNDRDWSPVTDLWGWRAPGTCGLGSHTPCWEAGVQPRGDLWILSDYKVRRNEVRCAATTRIQNRPSMDMGASGAGQGPTALRSKVLTQASGHASTETPRELSSARCPYRLAGWDMRATPVWVGGQSLCPASRAAAVFQGLPPEGSSLR